jgi:hypothetical protein
LLSLSAPSLRTKHSIQKAANKSIQTAILVTANEHPSRRTGVKGIDPFTATLPYWDAAKMFLPDGMHVLSNVSKQVFQLLGNRSSMQFTPERRQFEINRRSNWGHLKPRKIAISARGARLRVPRIEYPAPKFHLTKVQQAEVDRRVSSLPMPRGRIAKPFQHFGSAKCEYTTD